MNRFMHSLKFSTTTFATMALSLAVLAGGASTAVAADVKLANGSTWKGDAGARVRVTYTLNGKELTLEGVVTKADKSFLQVEVDENGKKVKRTITSFDLKKVETLAADGAASTKSTSGSSGGATPTKSNTTSGSTNAGGSATAAAPASGKQTIFILPWGRGPGGDVDMVGLGARHEEIEKIGAEADKIGPGQIIVLEINSGGGLVLEGDKIDETLNKLRERHRVIAWIHEAISAAAFTALHCNEIYFQRVGTLGAITMFAGTKSIEGRELEAWLKKVGDVCEATNRSRWIGEAMVTNEPELSYDKDEEGNVTWYNTLQGKYDLSDKVQNLTINAQQSEHSKFSQGTADTIPDLLKLLNLSPEQVVISQAGYKIHNDWQSIMKQCKEAKIKLLRDMQNPPGLSQLDQLNARLRAAKEIRKWFDKCFPIMTYDQPAAGSPEQWDGIIEDLSRQIKQAKDRRN